MGTSLTRTISTRMKKTRRKSKHAPPLSLASSGATSFIELSMGLFAALTAG